MKKFNGFPKAYAQSIQTRLLYLYKQGFITRAQYTRAKFSLVFLMAYE